MNRAERRRRARRRGRRGGYLGRTIALAQAVGQARGPGVYLVRVVHDPACPRPEGGRCRCRPDVELVAGPGVRN